MIPQIKLVRSGLTTSRLAFGTSRLHYSSAADRQRLLAAALDLGMTHFDTAPAYGDGLAERELGTFLKGRRSGVVVATKYGIPPNPVSSAVPSLTMPILALRAIARRAGLLSGKLPVITTSGLRQSAERSLRRLSIDTIDVLLLHEPSYERVQDPDGLADEFQRLRQRGLVKYFGVAGEWTGIESLLQNTKIKCDIIQTRETEWVGECTPDITYGAVAGSSQSYGTAQSQITDARSKLQAALARRPSGSVIVSTTKVANLPALARASEF